MDIQKQLEGPVEVRFLGGFLHGRRAYMANPECRMVMESATGYSISYRRRTVESINESGELLTVATYAPDGFTDHEFTCLVVETAREGTFKASLD